LGRIHTADDEGAIVTTPLTAEEVTAIEERASKAEPEPWTARRYSGITDHTFIKPEMTFASWEFCCAARSDVPRLCETIKAKDETIRTQAARIAELEKELAFRNDEIFHRQLDQRYANDEIARQAARIAELEKWKAEQQSALIKMAIELLNAGYKGDGVIDGMKWMRAVNERLRTMIQAQANW
jgi:hypothetical protein